MTLTSDLFLIIILSGAYLIFLGRNSKFGAYMHLGMAACHIPFLGHCDSDLSF